jgi:hypothetical protein
MNHFEKISWCERFLFCSSKEQEYDQLDDGSSPTPSPSHILDIEDMGSGSRPSGSLRPMATKRKRGQMEMASCMSQRSASKKTTSDVDLRKSWREVLGEQPEWGSSRVSTSNYGCKTADFCKIADFSFPKKLNYRIQTLWLNGRVFLLFDWLKREASWKLGYYKYWKLRYGWASRRSEKWYRCG